MVFVVAVGVVVAVATVDEIQFASQDLVPIRSFFDNAANMYSMSKLQVSKM